jgi:hypothetical protein
MVWVLAWDKESNPKYYEKKEILDMRDGMAVERQCMSAPSAFAE